MTEPTATRDLEADLRTLLRDRAATVEGTPPPLPDASHLADGAPATTHLHGTHGRRNRWLAAAAAAVVVMAGIGVAVVARGGGNDHAQVVTTTPPIEGAGLPVGFDPTTAQPVFRLEGSRNAKVVARSYLAWRLSDNGTDVGAVADDLVLDTGTPQGAIVPVRWRRTSDVDDRGTVLVKVGKRGSEVVASTTVGVDLSRVVVDGPVIRGRVQTTGDAPTPAALIDVLPRGRALPTFGDPPELAAGSVGYGTAARGDASFHVDTKGEGGVVTARFIDDRVEAISEVYLEAPDPNAPHLSTMTPEQMREFLDNRPPDPRCVAAEKANHDNLTNMFPNGTGTAAPKPSGTDVFDLPRSSTPAEAVHVLGTALGVPLELATIAVPAASTVSAAANVGLTPVELLVSEGDGGWVANSVDTTGACRSMGKGNLTGTGVPNPKTLLFLTVAAGAVEGRAWYRMKDGSTWTLPLDADDFARRNIAVDGDWNDVAGFAVVGRDRSGRVVVVQQDTF